MLFHSRSGSLIDTHVQNKHVNVSRVSRVSASVLVLFCFVCLVFVVPSMVAMPVHGLYMTLVSGTERCLSEDTSVGNLVQFEYGIAPLSATAVVTIKDSTGARVYQKPSTSTSETDVTKVSYTSTTNGPYEICFYNRDAQVSLEVRVVIRVTGQSEDVSTGVSSTTKSASKDALKPMESKLQELERTVSEILVSLQDSNSRHVRMSTLHDATGSRVVWWSAIGTLIMIAVKGFEVLHLHSFFQSRRLLR